MTHSADQHTPLQETDWQARAIQHKSTVLKWTQPHRKRRDSRTKHPIYDFLFTYYPFSLSKLEQWHPRYGVSLKISEADQIPAIYLTKFYQASKEHITLSTKNLRDKEIDRIKWIHNLLILTESRPANFACYGMHEWAMVYKTAQANVDLRHREAAPLRFSQEETNSIVESRPIRCTHFDAFRFFTPPAIPLNKLQPTLEGRPNHEQSGCLHSNMDIYKWASKCMPWVGSDLLWQCFQLALKARELDMRASPYDLTEYGYTPVKIETPEGRLEYETLQRQITEEAKPLRQSIINTLVKLLV